MAEIIRKTTGAISTIVGSLMIFHAVADSYQGRLAVITNLVNLVQHLPELVIGTILVITGYLLYPTEYGRESLEDTFHLDEDGNLQ
jgi:hypothetical protein